MNLPLIPLIAGRHVGLIRDVILEHLYQIRLNAHCSKLVPDWTLLHVQIVSQIQMTVPSVTLLVYAL